MSIIENISNFIFQDKDFLKWQNPWMFWGILVLTAVVILFIFIKRNQKKQLQKFATASALKLIMPRFSKHNATVRFVIWSLAFLAFILAGANLQFGDKKEEITRSGIDIIICLDVSKSMLAEDLKPNRLSRAKLAINNILKELGSDRVGIVVFAGDAYLQLPLTSDHEAAELFVNEISTNVIPTQGTNIASALELAKSSFPENSPTNKAIIVISDGEEHDGKAVEIAENLADEKISVFAIGLGSAQGTTIPNFINNQRYGVKKDKNGSTVITRLNEQALQDIANAGNGKYVLGSSQSLGLNTVLSSISSIEKTEYETKEYTAYQSQFQIFLIIGILLLLIELSWWHKKLGKQ